MNGFDCQEYERLKTKVKDSDLELELRGDMIFIVTCGGFSSVKEAFSYMCGYENGRVRK